MEFKPGLVIRYDFLWKHEADRGQDSGKDRPCAVVLMSKLLSDGTRRVAVAPITHTPPKGVSNSVEIPHKAARHLRLDDERMWVRTDNLNYFSLKPNQIPIGVSKTRDGRESYGMLPQQLGKQVFSQLVENDRARKTERVKRDDDAFIKSVSAQRERFKDRPVTTPTNDKDRLK